MFVCQSCSALIGPKVSPILAVEEQPIMHEHLNADGVPTQTEGTMIVREYKVCHTCAGVAAPQPKVGPKVYLEEAQAAPFKHSLAAIVLESAQEKALVTEARRVSGLRFNKHMNRDVMVTLSIMQAYQDRGGKL